MTWRNRRVGSGRVLICDVNAWRMGNNSATRTVTISQTAGLNY